MTLNEYLKNPCGLSSIPYWKAKSIMIPENMIILHQREFRESLLNNYIDETYFRLYHDLKSMNEIVIPGIEIITASNRDIPIIVDIINQSYVDMQASCKQFEDDTKTPVYNSDLWILVKNTVDNKYIGCGITDFVCKAKELILEWIQVLPEYRNKDFGQLIVNELLCRGVVKILQILLPFPVRLTIYQNLKGYIENADLQVMTYGMFLLKGNVLGLKKSPKMFAYFNDEKIIGFYPIEINGNSCELNNLCVLPEYRHNGTGEKLLKHCMEMAYFLKTAKIIISIVEENKKLKKWYMKFGFTPVYTKKYDFFPFTCGYMVYHLP